jgi:hypothetical protein
MEKLIDAINSNQEIVKLRNRYYELAGKRIPFHWKEFNIITYKEHLRKKVHEVEEQQLKK